jgi:hypothetical protein
MTYDESEGEDIGWVRAELSLGVGGVGCHP